MANNDLRIDDRGLVMRPDPAPLPAGPATVADVLRDALAANPHAEALVGRSGRYTFRELDAAADAAGAALQSLGIQAGDRVAASLPNDTPILIAFLGAMRIGAIWVGVNRQLTASEKTYMLTDSGAKVFITTAEMAGAADHWPCAVLTGDWLALVVEHRGRTPARPPINPHAPAAISYTSGTTGFPKGAVHSQHNLLWQGVNILLNDPPPPNERQGVTFPLTLLNLVVLCALQSWVVNVPLVCVDRTDALGLRDWIRDEQITRIHFAPAMVFDLVNHPEVDIADLKSLRRPECGGSATPPALREVFQTTFGTKLYTGYGLTECPGGAAREMPGQTLFPGGSGTALAPVDIVIVDENDNPVGPGVVGEVCIGPRKTGRWRDVYTPFLGYWNKPDATAKALRGGVLHTDDLGELTKDGYLFIKDRRKDLLIRGGANVYPAEVERVLATHPAVAASAVLGLPDERLGEIVAAVVQLRLGHEHSQGEVALAEHCGRDLARYKVPTRWAFIDEFARTPMGKIRKGDLKELFA